MFKNLILSLIFLASVAFAGPVEYLEAIKMTNIQKVQEVPENCQIALVINMVTIKDKPVMANAMYAGKIYADHIKWLEMGDLAIDCVYFSTDSSGATWCTMFTPNMIFALKDVEDPEVRKTSRFVLTSLTLSTGARMFMLLQ